MTSTRTDYREKRIDLICDSISRLSKFLLLYKRDLEHINLPLLKETNENVKKMENEVNNFSTVSKKETMTLMAQETHGIGMALATDKNPK